MSTATTGLRISVISTVSRITGYPRRATLHYACAGPVMIVTISAASNSLGRPHFAS